MNLIILTIILFHYYYAHGIDNANEDPLVKTKYGKVQGFNALNGSISVFFGIPYARPPLGKYRFEKPHEPKKWNGTLNATAQRNACFPHTTTMDAAGNFIGNFTEDCLILNIFAPNNKINKNAVFVIIHGGGFESGSASQFSNFTDIGIKFVQHGIVVVGIQYRVGQLGFASTGDNILPGNLGLWDQTAALKWENIAAFGGDPSQITVKGDSAGAKSVSALTLSPHSRDFFSRAIQMSGSSLDSAVTGSLVPNETMRMASILGCPMESGSRAIKKCLNGKSAEEMMRAVNQMGQARRGPNTYFFTPRFDGHFFPKSTTKLVKNAPKKETLFGFNKLESLLFTLFTGQNFTNNHQMLPWGEIGGYGAEQFRNYISTFVATKERFGANEAEEVAEKIFQFYSSRQINTTDEYGQNYFYIRQWKEMLGDMAYVVPIIREVEEKAKRGWPIYLYHFEYVNAGIFPPVVKIHESFHTYDLGHVFNVGLPSFGQEELAIEAFMVDAFRNFIKNGNPSTPWCSNSSNPILWPRVFPNQLNHFAIKSPKPLKMANMPDVLERVEFWAELTNEYPQFDLILEKSRGK